MNNFIRFLERYHFVILFILLSGVSLWMYLNTTYYQKAQVGRLTKYISGAVAGQFSNVGQYIQLRRTNIALTLENVALRNEIERLKATLEERGYSTRVDSLSGARFLHIPARVVNNSVNRQHNFITLNVGLNEGVTPGMGVICDSGVVGVVASVSRNFCTVISVLNISLRVSAKHGKSGIFGSLSWDGVNYREVSLRDIPLHVDIAQGDTIVSSGFSAIFPRDIPIGTISDFYRKDGSFHTIRVLLLTDFRQLNSVYVVKSFDSTEITATEINSSNG